MVSSDELRLASRRSPTLSRAFSPAAAAAAAAAYQASSEKAGFLALVSSSAKLIVSRALFARDSATRSLSLRLIQAILSTVARSIAPTASQQQQEQEQEQQDEQANEQERTAAPHPIMQQLLEHAKAIKLAIKTGNSDECSTACCNSFRLEVLKLLTCITRNCSSAHVQPLLIKHRALSLCVDMLTQWRHLSILHAAILELLRTVVRLHQPIAQIMFGQQFDLIGRTVRAFKHEKRLLPKGSGSSLTAHLLEVAVLIRYYFSTNRTALLEISAETQTLWVGFEQKYVCPYLDMQKQSSKHLHTSLEGSGSGSSSGSGSGSGSGGRATGEATLIRTDAYNSILPD
jgi:hypothetical protein